jgi:hypothetical protein
MPLFNSRERMGQDSESIELQTEDALDLKIVSAGASQSETTAGALPGDGAGISIESSDLPDLELQLSPSRPLFMAAALSGEGTSVVDLGDDLLERTAVLTTAPALAPLEGTTPHVGVLEAVLEPNVSSDAAFPPDGGLDLSPLAPHDSVSGSPAEANARPVLTELAPGGPCQGMGFIHDLEEPEFLRSREKDREVDALWSRLALEFGVDDRPLQSMHIITSGEADHLEVGIACMEMGMFEAALHEFGAAKRGETSFGAAVVPLEAQALLSLQQPFRALDLIESVVGDPDLKDITLDPLRVELQYWAARSCEALGRDAEAVAWLRLVIEAAPGHRDSGQRLHRLTRGDP